MLKIILFFISITIFFVYANIPDPFKSNRIQPHISIDEISEAQTACMFYCAKKENRDDNECLSENIFYQWSCQTVRPGPPPSSLINCQNQEKYITLSSIDCTCIRTSASETCPSVTEIMVDIFGR